MKTPVDIFKKAKLKHDLEKREKKKKEKDAKIALELAREALIDIKKENNLNWTIFEVKYSLYGEYELPMDHHGIRVYIKFRLGKYVWGKEDSGSLEDLIKDICESHFYLEG